MQPITPFFLLIYVLLLTVQVLASSLPRNQLIVIADNRKYLGGKRIELDFKPKVLQIVFDSHQQQYGKLIYELQLTGIEEIYRTHEPVARYTFLPGGDHQLKYRVLGSREEMSHWAVQEIRIKREINEMPWFYPVLWGYIIIIIGAVVYLWIIYNLRQKLKLQTLRSKISADLHDETGATLSSVAFDLGTLEQLHPARTEKIQNLISEIRNTVDEAMLKLRDTLWSIQPEHDDLLHLSRRISQSAAKIFAFKPIKLEFINELREEDNFRIAMERRGDILHIAKEALNNCIKHAQCKKVKLHFKSVKNGAQLSIIDDGVGFDPKHLPDDANGLRNFKLRGEASFLEIKVKSQIGEGTTIEVLIPKL